MFWITLRSLWYDWRHPLMYVQADTVVRWQRERFRRFWARLSKRRGCGRGRRGATIELRRFIERMAAANLLWHAPRIHGELNMLGIAISERTVSRVLRKLRRPPNQIWKTFLHNHVGQVVSTDFFTVPTFTMKMLFVFNAPQRPAQPAQRDDLLLLWFAQNIAHIDGAYPPSGNVLSQLFVGRFSGDPVWPVLGDPPRFTPVRAAASLRVIISGDGYHRPNPSAHRLLAHVPADMVLSRKQSRIVQ